MNIINYLASDNYIVVNKVLIRKFGLNEAIMLGELCSEYNYFQKEGRLVDDRFYSTIENIEENTGLTAHEQRQAIQSLKNAGVLEVELRGIPAKRYFLLDISTVVKILTTCDADFSQQDTKKLHSNNNNKNNKNNNKTISKDIVGDTPSVSNRVIDISEKKPKKNVYSNCVDLINAFTDDTDLRKLLVDFLKICLENSREVGRPFYKNMFIGKLNSLKKLSTDTEEQKQIVQRTLHNGWACFYELDNQVQKKKSSRYTVDEPTDMGYTAERANKEHMTYEEKY